MENPAVVSFDNVSFAYDRHEVLRSVSLEFFPDEFIGIVGPNGGGKTTFLKLVLGINKPDSGTVRVFGKDPSEISSQIGYVPQYIMFDPYFPVDARDVVLMGRLGFRKFGFFGTKDRKLAHQALEEVGLGDVARMPFADLSGGQRQRVLIARALAAQPRIMLLDEPTANIDQKAAKDLYELLKNLSKSMTVGIVSHDIGVISNHVQRVVCVNRKVSIHPTSELTGDLISSLYGGDISLIRHDHCCSKEGHKC